MRLLSAHFYGVCQPVRMSRYISGKVHGWQTSTKPMGAVAKKFVYKQKRDNRRFTVAGVYKLVSVKLVV